MGDSTGLGWVPDLPDHRDYLYMADQEVGQTANSGRSSLRDAWKNISSALETRLNEIEETSGKKSKGPLQKMLNKQIQEMYSGADKNIYSGKERGLVLLQPDVPKEDELVDCVDLRYFMSPMENQEDIGSCTAHAVIGLVEYLQIATRAEYIDASRLFLYKTTRNLLKWNGDTGAYVRSAFKALQLFGSCPEEYYPYQTEYFDYEPSAFHYSFAQNYQALRFYRLNNLIEIRQSLTQGYPVAFGFTCFESSFSESANETGVIPYPSRFERPSGGHAVLAVGYVMRESPRWDKVMPKGLKKDDDYIIFRNSWGPDWGDYGYGYLPMSYFIGGHDKKAALADDYWTMTQMESKRIENTNPAPFITHHSVEKMPWEVKQKARNKNKCAGQPWMGGQPWMQGQPWMGGHPHMSGQPYMGGQPVMYMNPKKQSD